MGMFSGIDVGRTGVGFARYWMDTVAHNLANTNTVRDAGEEPFRARLVVAQALNGPSLSPAGSGVAVGGVVEDGAEASRLFDPEHPQADEDGYVTLPVVDLAAQMTDLMISNRSYQANLKTIETAREAYQAALRLGQQR